MRADGLSLELTRVLPVARERVFGCFADAAVLARWWGPTGFSVPRIDFAPRAGAAYRIDMQPPEGAAFALTGAFREVDPPKRLAFSFAWEPPDPDDRETVVTLSFRAAGSSTEVDLSQGPFKTEARRELHRAGWTESLDRLRGLLAAAPRCAQRAV